MQLLKNNMPVSVQKSTKHRSSTSWSQSRLVFFCLFVFQKCYKLYKIQMVQPPRKKLTAIQSLKRQMAPVLHLKKTKKQRHTQRRGGSVNTHHCVFNCSSWTPLEAFHQRQGWFENVLCQAKLARDVGS